MSLTLLTYSNLWLKFWDFAFETAVYLINHLPTRSLQLISPYQVPHGCSDCSFLRALVVDVFRTFDPMPITNLILILALASSLVIPQTIMAIVAWILSLVVSSLLVLLYLMSNSFHIGPLTRLLSGTLLRHSRDYPTLCLSQIRTTIYQPSLTSCCGCFSSWGKFGYWCDWSYF